MWIWAQDYKHLPDGVMTPLTTLLDYALWFAEFCCLLWLIFSACRYFALRHSTVETLADAHNAVLRSLTAAVLATCSLGIALAVLEAPSRR